MNFAERLLAGRRDAGKAALITLEAEHSYGELSRSVLGAAYFLARSGAKKGDCVGIAAENSFLWVVGYLGAIRAGCVAVPISSQLPPADCRALIEQTQMRFAFVEARLASAPWLATVSNLVLDKPVASTATLGGLASEAPVELPQASGDDLAAILFSSGSTGKPRGVMLSHANLTANTESIAAALELNASDRAMQVLPFHYSFGASVLQTHLLVGGTVVVDKRFLFPDKVLQRMIETRCTGFAGVPSHYQILLRKSSFKQLQFPDLRWLQQAGGKLQEAFVRELRAAKPNARLYIMYGATEATARLSILPHAELDTHFGSIGRGIPGVKLRVLDEKGKQVLPGEHGEIVAEGLNISRGYYRDPHETAASFRDGKLHTGDLATVDADGFIYVIGREKSFLKTGGTRISADRFEEALLAFEGIVEVAVIGVPDEVMGEAPAAFVVARDASDATFLPRLRAFAEKLAPVMRPKLIELVSELPKSAAGKVQRMKLYERLRGSAAAA
ncbi:MAG TPA: AMP-binding protein [Myxococcales bacterium]|nr:AMP-binding protein [Myxococcales bacterium]